jgi:signal transduction histidine kinase
VRRVWAFVAAIWAVAALLAWIILDWDPIIDTVTPPWFVLVIMFGVAERAVFHLRFRKDAHSFSLSEIPLVLALFVASPIAAIIAQMTANAIALLLRRQQAVKFAFNLGQFAVQTALAILVFRPIVSFGDELGPAGWMAAVWAALVALFVAEVMIYSVIRLSGGRLSVKEAYEVMILSALATIMNTATALIGVVLLVREPRSAWLTAVPPVILYVAYRAYVNQREESGRLESLYDATRALHAAPQIESALQAAVESARSMVDAEYAEVFIYPIEGETAYTTSSGPGEHSRTLESADAAATREMRALSGAAKNGLLAGPVERSLGNDTLIIDQAIVAPMYSGGRVIGVVLAANRLGDVSQFVTEDVGLVDTLAGQVAVSLENGRLGESLAQITYLKEQLEELIRSKDEFVASVSHELRTPLTAVAGLADELRSSPALFSQSETHEFIQLIADQSHELAGIVEDLLVAGRSQMGEQNLDIQEFDLANEAREVVDNITRSGIRLAVKLDHPDDEALAHGDPLRVRQILRNLLTNASRYGGEEVTVHVSHSGTQCRLAVVDNGDGVPPADAERIFDSYQRSNNAIQEPKSVGLGLSVSRKLARLMSGDLKYSRDNGLTWFELTLPAVNTARSRLPIS